MTRNILAIHAHPDDIEILAGGTLALLAQGGHRITCVSMTPGDCGSSDRSPEEIAAIRRAEAASAAALIGASYSCAEFRDLGIFSDDASRRKVVEILRKHQPDVVLTASPVDYMADHEATSELVRDACFGAPVPNYLTGSPDAAPVLKAIPHLYFMDPIGGVDRDDRPVRVDFYIEVEDVFDVKRRMLAAHASQRDWLKAHHGMDHYLEQMEAWTRGQGRRCGCALAEGFRRYKGHPYPQTRLLEELLGEAVRAPIAA